MELNSALLNFLMCDCSLMWKVLEFCMTSESMYHNNIILVVYQPTRATHV